jgi:hypothetical protein
LSNILLWLYRYLYVPLLTSDRQTSLLVEGLLTPIMVDRRSPPDAPPSMV